MALNKKSCIRIAAIVMDEFTTVAAANAFAKRFSNLSTSPTSTQEQRQPSRASHPRRLYPFDLRRANYRQSLTPSRRDWALKQSLSKCAPRWRPLSRGRRRCEHPGESLREATYLLSRREWCRTTDLYRVKVALYR